MNDTLKLYKQLLRYSSRMASYNFRQYAVRRVRDSFIANKALSDPAAIKQELEKGYQQLEVVKRQSLISQMYKGDRLVVE